MPFLLSAHAPDLRGKGANAVAPCVAIPQKRRMTMPDLMVPDLMMPEFHITGAEVLRPEGLCDAPLGIAAGQVAAEASGRALHLPGWQVLPGIVDVHGDGFERHLAPRRGAMRDLGAGLMAVEAELAANGITTACLAQFYSWEGGMRGPDFAAEMLRALDDVRPRVATDLRVQLRVETHLIDDYPAIEALIAAHDIRYVVFNDHIPHDALARGKRPPRLTGQALKSGRNPEAHLALLQSLHDRRAEVPAALAQFAARLTARDVLLGSHDDATTADRKTARGQGLRISEFPETAEVAADATEAGDAIVMGAPNVVRGQSHAGKVSAGFIAREGMCTALASDYHYPAPFQAAMALAPDMGLVAAWALVSSGPAAMLGLADRGALTTGARADLVAINPETRRPGLTVSGGRITYADHHATAALLTA